MKLITLLEAILPERFYEPNGHFEIDSGDSENMRDAGSADTDILSIHYRAQDVRPGGLFVAIPGQKSDGYDFIPTAVANGAAAVVATRVPVTPIDAAVILVTDARHALAALAHQFYGRPSEHLTIIGITGTNGKTTTAFLIERILKKAGFAVGVIGTLNYRYQDMVFDNPMTTPESLDLQRILSDMLHVGVTHVIMEASSHAIALRRIDCCWMDVGVFTNLTQDHLDFHGTLDAYWNVKKGMFTGHLSEGPKRSRAAAVINCNDPRGEELYNALHINRFCVGFSEDYPVQIAMMKTHMDGADGVITTPLGMFQFKTSLIGRHNVENILCATAACVTLNISLKTIRESIESVSFVPGRLQQVFNDRLRHVFVDYAHTPDALMNVLRTIQEIASHRIICVFGCGGDRDKDKRPMMGQIAARQADLLVVTSDNPRSEDPMDIILQIEKGIQTEQIPPVLANELTPNFSGKRYVIEPDRKKAIYLAIRVSGIGDVILIAGKGHETYQIIGGQKFPFDDREIAASALTTEINPPNIHMWKKKSTQAKTVA
ncbi:MAG TPA: UDP-N-acetylmuramoyl-L-alanyl-D-glutamate--2,6-diaminopimelate ligase [Desulfatirhabdiaceae bacterium]|nr:UDP-N-acetylmuramoyl-L-alanyl-D-glutamate--2,6-diaminopimelate ligase [Desulfatirhabdiaceae bacterium]